MTTTTKIHFTSVLVTLCKGHKILDEVMAELSRYEGVVSSGKITDFGGEDDHFLRISTYI